MQGASGGNTRKHLIAAEPFWFMAALLPMLASQVLRLQQSDPAAWLLCDYAGRVGALLILAAIPAASAAAFRYEELRITGEEVLGWILAIVLAFFIINHLAGPIASALPSLRLGSYPQLHGWLYGLDLTFGLALVAFQEEIVFRRCARHLFRSLGDRWGDGWGMILATSLMFGAYHWWTGIPNVISAALFGIAAMLFYRRAGAIWPIMIVHYIMDFIAFV
jgi:membrane protease YdiL (CAAX protease family)